MGKRICLIDADQWAVEVAHGRNRCRGETAEFESKRLNRGLD
jgi:hypothetical protein